MFSSRFPTSRRRWRSPCIAAAGVALWLLLLSPLAIAHSAGPDGARPIEPATTPTPTAQTPTERPKPDDEKIEDEPSETADDSSGDESKAADDSAGESAREAPPAIPVLAPVGEKLVYRGILTKAGVSVDAGTATFTVTRNDDERIQLTACAVGEKFGYSLATKIISILGTDRLGPQHYEYLQQGSESRLKQVDFEPKSAVYRRYKHCAELDCEIAEHRIDGAHCPDRDCRIPAHMHWKVRHEHEFTQRHFDMLSAVYFARGLPLEPGAPPIEVPVLNDHDRWIVRASAKRGGRLRVKAGIFDTVKIILDPTPAPGTTPEERFTGLFGLNGTIEIWLDRKTIRPLLVRGQLPFGFMDLSAKVELIEIGQATEPCDLGPPRKKGNEDVDDFGQ